MKIPRPQGRISGRIWGGSLLLATIAVASLTSGLSAVAAPLSAATALHQASGGGRPQAAAGAG